MKKQTLVLFLIFGLLTANLPLCPLHAADKKVSTKAEKEMFRAVIKGNYRKVRQLLHQGINVNMRDKNECTPLHRAAASGRSIMVKLLIDNDAEVNAKAKHNLTPLHSAANGNHTGIANLLIENGADINAKDIDGSTPLHRASLNGDKEVIELLLNRGAKINEKNKEGCTSLQLATENNRKKNIQLLIARGAEIDLHTACRIGDLDNLRRLIEAGSNVNTKGVNDMTPLHYAVLDAQVAAVKLLSENGADLNAQEKISGYTPLHYAVMNGHAHVVEVLLEKGAAVNAKNKAGKTPLYFATTFRRFEEEKLLLKFGAVK